jgi:hypothetical protein
MKGAGPLLLFVGTITSEAAPRFAVFETWAPRRMISGAWLKESQLSCRLHAAVVANDKKSRSVVPTFRKSRKVGQPQS